MPKTLPATKHFKLAQTLRAQIRKMSPGDPLPTVLQLRERFSVSQATVDRALDRLRREGLITRPAGQLRPVVTDTPLPTLHRVALIRPAVPSAFYEQVAREVARIGMQKEWAFEWINYSSLTSARLREALGDHDAAVFMPSAEHLPAGGDDSACRHWIACRLGEDRRCGSGRRGGAPPAFTRPCPDSLRTG